MTRWSLGLLTGVALPWLTGCQKPEVRVLSAPVGQTNSNINAAVTPAPTNVNANGAVAFEAVTAASTKSTVAGTPTNAQPAATTAIAATPAPVPPPVPSQTLERDGGPLKPVVPQVKLSPEMLEVVRLAHANVGDQVLREFIAGLNFPSDITADEIVFLKDVGISDEVITAVMQRRREGVAQGFARGASSIVAQGQAPPPPAQVAQVQSVPQATSTAVVTTPVAAEQQPAIVQQPVVVQAPPPQQITQNYFYESLTPYGTWVQVVDYGWCWRPTVATLQVGWRPYCDSGRWLWTDCGWYWQSDYSWGWAPFHYGRWHMAGPHGWVWIPGHEWGPAWVTWRHTPTHCGWAPLPPGAHFRAGVGLTFHGSGVDVGFGFGLTLGHYSFVPVGRLHDPGVRSHVIPSTHSAQVYNNSTVVNNYIVGNNNTIVNGGISADRVSVASRTEIRKVSIREMGAGEAVSQKADRLERNGAALAVYRPQLPPQAPAPPSHMLNTTSARNEKASTAPGSSSFASGGPNAAIIPSLSGIPLAAPSNGRGGARTPAMPAASSQGSAVSGVAASVPLTVPRPSSASAAVPNERANGGAFRRMDERPTANAPAAAAVPQRNGSVPVAGNRQPELRANDRVPSATTTIPARRLESRDSVTTSSGLLAQPQQGALRQDPSRVPQLPPNAPAASANPLDSRSVRNDLRVPGNQPPQIGAAPQVPQRPVPGAAAPAPAPSYQSRPVPGASSPPPISAPVRGFEPSRAPQTVPAAPQRYEAPRNGAGSSPGATPDSRNERGNGRNRPN